MSGKNKKNRKSSNAALTIGIVICLAVMAYAGFRLVSTLVAYRQGEKEYQTIADTYTASYSDTGETLDPSRAASADSAENGAAAAEETPPITVDFDALQKLNADVTGWLYLPALGISYPIMQGEDDDYYLHRTTERTYNFSGSIFIEAKNSRNFEDPNTIVYGHNMKNGSMFGTLSHLVSQEKYRDDSTFWILTPEKNYKYQMFSLHQTNVESDVYTLFDGTDQTFVEWAEKMKGESAVELGFDSFNTESKIVTLSTCTGNSATRFVVQGVRLN